MRIVIGTDTFYPIFERGGEVNTFNLARELVKLGQEVTVLCSKTSSYFHDRARRLPEHEVADGINIIRSKQPFKFGATLTSLPSMIEKYRTLRDMIKNNRVDIVNVVTYRPRLPFYLAAKGKIPCTATFHILSLEGRWRGFEDWKDYESGKFAATAGYLLENLTVRLPYDGVMAVSDNVRDKLLKYHHAEKIWPIYIGVDLETIDKIKSGPKKPAQIAFLGSLDQRKNVLDAVAAARLAKKELKDLSLVIISTGGEFEEAVTRACQDDSYITYHKQAPRETIMKLLKESSLLVLPSSKEGGMVTSLLEALACHTPFLAYDIPTIQETYWKTMGGVLTPYKDCEAFALKICELLSDQAQLQKLAQKGRRQVEAQFTWTSTAKRMESAFKHILDRY